MSGMDALRAAMEARKSDAMKRKATSGRTWVKRTELEQDTKKAAIIEHETRLAAEEAKEQERLRAMQDYLRTKEMKQMEKEVEETAVVQEDAVPHWEAQGEEDIPPLELWDVMCRLRSFGQPITLFNETQAQRYKRLRTIEQEDAENSLTTFGHGYGHHAAQSSTDVNDVEIDAEYNDKITGASTGDKEAAIIVWMKEVIGAWTDELKDRPGDKAKEEVRAHHLMKADLRPFVLKLKHNKVDKQLRNDLSVIVQMARERRYASATRAYMELTVGDAKWPVGAPNTSIHQRANDGMTAGGEHVLSEDGAKKACVAIKRMLTYAQSRWPATEPEDL